MADINSIRVGQLPNEVISLTDKIPHEVGDDLKRATIEDLAIFISNYASTIIGVGFRAVTVLDGQTLPETDKQEFILVGSGTFYNVNGGSTIVLTEELNALISNGAFWTVGVEIPVNIQSVITQSVRDGFTNTSPSEDAIYNYLLSYAKLSDLPSPIKEVIEVVNVPSLPLTGEVGKIYVVKDLNKIYRWNSTFYQELADNDNVKLTGDQTKSGILTLSDQLILGESSGSPQNLIKFPADSYLKYNNSNASQYDFNITALGADNFFWVNDEGNSRQALFYGDGDSAIDSDIFGISSSQDSGATWSKAFSVTQRGVGYVRSSLTANSFIKSGGLSTEYLKADGSVSTLPYPITGTGVIGKIAFFTSASAQTSDNLLQWDNSGKRLGVGTSSPAGKIDIRDTNGGTFFDGSNATYNRWKSFGTEVGFGKDILFSTMNSGTSPDLYIFKTGRTGFGTLTDNLVDKVQVNGSVSASSFNGSATLTGTPTAPTAAVGTNTTQIATTAFVKANTRPYKVYTALISQTGTSAPTAIILENTLGGTVVFSYSGVGLYQATFTGNFVSDKTWTSITSTASADVTLTAGWSSIDTVNINAYLSGTLYNSVMSKSCLEIRVYN